MSTPAQIRFFQVGSFAVGNRLLDPAERTVQADTARANCAHLGHRACQGCGEALGARASCWTRRCGPRRVASSR